MNQEVMRVLVSNLSENEVQKRSTIGITDEAYEMHVRDRKYLWDRK